MTVKIRSGNEWVSVSGGGSGGESIGTIFAWSGTSSNIPAGYLLCDGAAISRTTYTALFAFIGTIHGVGDGSSTFNIPDLRDRFIVGASNSSGDNTYPGVSPAATGGVADSIIAQHTHQLPAIRLNNYNDSTVNITLGSGQGYAIGYANNNVMSSSVTNTTGSTSTTNANLPPYYSLCYIIKVLNTTEGGGSGATGGNGFVILPEKTATDTSIEFTGIPSDAQEITLMFIGVSANGNNDLVVQLGTSSGYITSGYVSNSENTQGTDEVHSTNGFVIYSHTSNSEHHGSMIINKASSDTYTAIGEFRRSNAGGAHARGSLSSVSGTVDRLKIKFTGSNTFDAGTVSISYKTRGLIVGETLTDKIEEGNTSAEVIDTGSDGHFIVKAEGKEKFRVNGATNNVFIGGHTTDNPFTYLRFAASQYGAADIRPMDELSHKIGLSFYVDNTQDSTINPIERMHLTHNGILNIGRAVGGASFDPVNATGDVTAGIKLLGATSSSTPGDGFAMIANAKTIVGIFNRTNTTGAVIEFKYNASVVGSVTTDGSGVSYGSDSDYRLKENIVGISDGITRLKTLKPYRFNFKSHPEKTVDGFLAHEVTAVPEAIIGTKDQVDSDNNPVYQQIDQSKLVPLLVSALQEAVAKIETLETKVAALEAG